MSSNRDESAGISLRDVEQGARAVELAHCCNVTISLTMPVTGGTSCLFWVKAEARPRIVGRKVVRGVVAVQRRWPHTDHKTLSGLMFWLVHELDASCERAGHVPAEQAVFDCG